MIAVAAALLNPMHQEDPMHLAPSLENSSNCEKHSSIRHITYYQSHNMRKEVVDAG